MAAKHTVIMIIMIYKVTDMLLVCSCVVVAELYATYSKPGGDVMATEP